MKANIYDSDCVRKYVWEYDSANYLFRNLEAKQDAETIFQEFSENYNDEINIPPSWWGVVHDMLIDLTVSDPNIVLEKIEEENCGLVVEYYPLSVMQVDYTSGHIIHEAKRQIDELVQEIVRIAKGDACDYVRIQK